MHLDARGLPISTTSAEAAAAYDHLVTGYLTFRADTPARLTALLELDPDFALAHCMQGYFATLTNSEAKGIEHTLAKGFTPEPVKADQHYDHRPGHTDSLTEDVCTHVTE